LAVVTDILNPERIVIGSIFARCEGFLRPEMERVWAAEALPGAVAACQVVTAGTGERIGDYASIMAACYPLGIDPAEWLKPDKPEVVARYERLFTRYPALEAVRPAVMDAFLLLRGAFSGGHKLLVCGNGGSAADSDHIVGELMKGFYLKRALGDRERRQYGAVAEKLQRALPAVSLTQHMALNSAFMNDVEPELIYAQQLYGYGRPGDVLLAISTSGNSKNVVAAAALAQKMGLRVIALTGASGGRLAGLADAAICAPAQETADVQELHLPIYHTLCAMLEEEYFGGAGQQ
jgi:D-sedoheptulose 7-phosphate isomerase